MGQGSWGLGKGWHVGGWTAGGSCISTSSAFLGLYSRSWVKKGQGYSRRAAGEGN